MFNISEVDIITVIEFDSVKERTVVGFLTIKAFIEFRLEKNTTETLIKL